MFLFYILLTSLALPENQALRVTLEGLTAERGLTAEQGLTVEQGLTAELSHRAQRRERRCSCENKKDHECIFFCHIGIVWVNTPSHLVPYGLGSTRLRREVDRCKCNDTRDNKCVRFCRVHTHENRHQNSKQESGENSGKSGAIRPGGGTAPPHFF